MSLSVKPVAKIFDQYRRDVPRRLFAQFEFGFWLDE
tara:strand:+ start:489 stop:596 length:108 start_codon:yes stop_codon:yes gene_type:complete